MGCVSLCTGSRASIATQTVWTTSRGFKRTGLAVTPAPDPPPGLRRSVPRGVEALSGLAPEQSRLVHPQEQGWRREKRFFELLVKRLGDGPDGVDADSVGE